MTQSTVFDTDSTQWALTDFASCEAQARAMRNEYLASVMADFGKRIFRAVQNFFHAPVRTRDA